MLGDLGLKRLEWQECHRILEKGHCLIGMKENMLSKFLGNMEHYWEMDMNKTTNKNENNDSVNKLYNLCFPSIRDQFKP